jgi:hypothetical protein
VKFKSITTFCAATLILIAAATKIHARQSTAPKSTPPSSGSSAVPSTQIQQKIETYLRNTYAWGSDFKLKFEPLKETPVPNLYEVKVEVSVNGQGDTATFYNRPGHKNPQRN